MMFRAIITPIAVVIIFSFLNFNVFAATEWQRVNPISKVIYVSGHTAGMNKGELDRSFNVIRKFQAGTITLPELDALSDRQILRKIDFYTEPYSQMVDESRMITWKRYELETEMLADKANVDLAKFAPFYRSFSVTMGIGKRIHDYQLSLRNASSTDSYTMLSNGSDGPEVECEASCSAIENEDNSSFEAILSFLEDMRSWEAEHGSLGLGSTARIVNEESGGSVDMRKTWGSVEWEPTSDVNNCGEAACL